MKKFAIAAALSAVTSVSLAQNVEIYGILDSGIQSHDAGAGAFTRAQNNALATSRLGFQGSEDLGNGVTARFQLESQLNPSTGSQGSTTVAANETFNREAWVGIASKTLGELRVGRTDLTSATDVDFRTSQFVNLATRPVNGTAIEFGTDTRNIVRYLSPTLGGFSFQLGHGSGNNAGATEDAQGDIRGAFVQYDDSKLKLLAGHHTKEATATAGERDYTSYGAAYDLGYASVGINYGEGDVNNANGAKNKTLNGSVRVPLAAGWTVYGVYGVAEDAAQASDNRGSGYTVGTTKSLSKRTTLYAAYTAVDNESNSAMYMSGQVAAPGAGLDTKTITAGISHRF